MRAAIAVGVRPCSAMATSRRSRKKRWSSVGSRPVTRQIEILGEGQAAHEVADEIAAAHLDRRGVGAWRWRVFAGSRLADQHVRFLPCARRRICREGGLRSRFSSRATGDRQRSALRGSLHGPGGGRSPHGWTSPVGRRRQSAAGAGAGAAGVAASTIGPRSWPPANFTRVAMRASIGGWVAKRPPRPAGARMVEEHLLHLRRRVDLRMAGDLAQRRDHGVGVLGQLDRAGIGEEFALARHGEAERDGKQAGDEEDRDRDQNEDDARRRRRCRCCWLRLAARLPPPLRRSSRRRCPPLLLPRSTTAARAARG